jgi:hypothetical protein
VAVADLEVKVNPDNLAVMLAVALAVQEQHQLLLVHLVVTVE